MKQCPNCRNAVKDDAVFCPVCGTAIDAVPGYMSNFFQTEAQDAPEPPVYVPPLPVVDPYDHTEDFDAADIGKTRLTCMLVYLLDFIGIIIALLMDKSSAYTAFHIRQSMKFTVVEVLLVLAVALLCWTFVVPVLAAVALVVLLVIKFVSFTQVCGGKAKEPVLIRSITFLK